MYADDIVLLSPTVAGLQHLLDIISSELDKIHLSLNCLKSKVMIFRPPGTKILNNINVFVQGYILSVVSEMKYLGYQLCDTLCNGPDIRKCHLSFLAQFNSLIRKFNKCDKKVFLHLFNSYCMSFFGSELWFSYKNCTALFKQVSISYHKAVKKILGISYRESSHLACEMSGLLTFNNFINLKKILFVRRLVTLPNMFMSSIRSHLLYFSSITESIRCLALNKYNLGNFFEDDTHALRARVFFVDRREPRSNFGYLSALAAANNSYVHDAA
jgi:hypothetical protein